MTDVENELIPESPRPKDWKVAVRSVRAGGWVVQHCPDVEKALALAEACLGYGSNRVEIEILPDPKTDVSTTDTENSPKSST